MGQQPNAAPAKPTAWTSLAQQQGAAQQQNAVANAGSGAIGGAAAITAASAAASAAAAAAGGNRNSTTDSFKQFQKAAKEKMDRQKLAQERAKAEREKMMRYEDVKGDPDVTMGNMDNNRQGTGGVFAGAGGATGGRVSVKQERSGGGGAPTPLLPK